MRAWQATVQDAAGNAVFNPHVTVYQEDGSTLADIFNEDGSSKENPFIGTTEGFAQFWADRGTYKVVGANGGVSETWQVDLADKAALELAQEAKTEAEQALEAAGIADGKAEDALSEAAHSFGTLAELLASTRSFTVGTIVATRAEGAAYEVVAAGASQYDFVTAGGVRLTRVAEQQGLGTIVIYGSSTLAGVGSSANTAPSAANGWTSGPNSCASIFAARVGARGQVINRSVGGRNMQSLLDNFDAEVAPYRPRFVVTGTGWVNEPGGDGREKAASYLSKAAQLVAKCRDIGAVPIFAAFNPINTWGGNRSDQYDVMRGLCKMGARVWPLFGGAADDLYAFKPGLHADAIHANDAGHALYANQFSIGDLFAAGRIEPRKNGGPSYEVECPEEPSSPVVSIRLTDPEDYCDSWTVSMVLRNRSATAQGSTLLCFRHTGANETTSGEFRIRQNNGLLSLARGSNTIIPSGIDPRDDHQPHRHVVSYDAQSQTVRWWIDGVLIGEATVTGIGQLRAVEFGRNIAGNFFGTGFAVRELALWRWNTLADGITPASLGRGYRPDFGLVADADFSAPILSSIANLANTRAVVSVLRASSYHYTGATSGDGYVRHPDGRQECWGRVVLTHISASGLGADFAFPLPFKDPSELVVSVTPFFPAMGQAKSGGSICGVLAPTANSVPVRMFSDGLYTDGTEAVTVMVHAIGTWM